MIKMTQIKTGNLEIVWFTRQLQARRQEPLLAEDEEAQGNWKVLMGASPKSIPTRELSPGRPDLADKKHTWWLRTDPRHSELSPYYDDTPVWAWTLELDLYCVYPVVQPYAVVQRGLQFPTVYRKGGARTSLAPGCAKTSLDDVVGRQSWCSRPCGLPWLQTGHRHTGCIRRKEDSPSIFNDANLYLAETAYKHISFQRLHFFLQTMGCAPVLRCASA